MASTKADFLRLSAVGECEGAASQLMAALYRLRSVCPVEECPEAWMLIPEAQSMLERIKRNVQLTKESLNG